MEEVFICTHRYYESGYQMVRRICEYPLSVRNYSNCICSSVLATESAFFFLLAQIRLCFVKMWLFSLSLEIYCWNFL